MESKPPSKTERVLSILFLSIHILVGVGVIAFVVTFAILGAVSKSHRKTCQDNLQRIGLALADYHSDYGTFPPTYVADSSGKPMHSWRVLLLPYLGYKDLYNAYRFDEPWDGPNNRKLGGMTPAVYRCPSTPAKQREQTSYLGVISRYTAWAGTQTTSDEQIRDGPSNTICLLEVANSGIHWMEPREMTFDEALGRTDNPKALRPSSFHGEVYYALFFDGAVHQLNSGTDQQVLGAFLSIGVTRRIDPIPWAPSADTATPDFTEIVDAASLRQSDIHAHLDEPIVPGRTSVWCGTFQLAWNELVDQILKEPLRFQEKVPMAEKLNQRRFDKGNLSEESYLAMAGRAEDGFFKRLQHALDKKFPGHSVTLEPVDHGFVLFAYLRKSLPFEMEFDDLKDPLTFRSKAGDRNVRVFGVIGRGDPDPKIQAQVTILDYVDDDDFLLQLSTKTHDSVVLAKVPPARTLRETLDVVRERIRQKSKEYQRKALETDEPLAIPYLTFSISRNYHELLDKWLANPGWEEWLIAKAPQVIRFRMDEKGAEVESWGGDLLTIANGGGAERPKLKPREFLFNKPFLLYLIEPKAREPYLVMWIENAEFMRQADRE